MTRVASVHSLLAVASSDVTPSPLAYRIGRGISLLAPRGARALFQLPVPAASRLGLGAQRRHAGSGHDAVAWRAPRRVWGLGLSSKRVLREAGRDGAAVERGERAQRVSRRVGV